MSATETAEAIARLQSLSDERARRVFSLIEDLAELEALEDAEDLKDAREALAELQSATACVPPSSDSGKNFVGEKEPATIPYDQLRRELGLDRNASH